jgi:aminobenzoyl-glutamate utilization protein B
MVQSTKQIAINWISKNEFLLVGVSNKIWEYAELGLREFKSSRLLSDTLEEHGFEVELGVAGMPTALIATYGSGKPVIGIMGEYDALRGLSQKAVPWREPVKEGAPGHGCGHNLYGSSGMGAAIATKVAMEAEHIKGTIKFFGTPSEETLVGKVFMVRDGFFNGVDAVMGHHIGAAHTSCLRSFNAMNSAKFIFYGTAAHAGSTPWQGRSALDAVELMNIGVNFMREHVIPEARIHYVIENGGDQPNVVPAQASSWYYVRAPRREVVEEIYEWVVDISEGATKMTKTRREVKLQTGVYNLLPNRNLAELQVKNMREIGPPSYTKEELEFARKIGKQISSESRKAWGYRAPGQENLPSDVDIDQRVVDPWGDGESTGGSSDESDVSWNAPLQVLNTASRIIGAPGHHWMNAAVAGMSIGHKNLLFASKVLAVSAIDLLTEPQLLKSAWEEFNRRKAGREYKSPLPPDLKPPLDQFQSP